MANDDPVGANDLDERHTDRVGQVGVELVGHETADVIGLDDPVQTALRHGRSLPAAPLAPSPHARGLGR